LAAGAAASATASVASAAAVTYAGFWRRVAAFLLDGILITAALGILAAPSGCGAAGLSNRPSSFEVSPCFGGLFHTVAAWLYFALLESSSLQATLGKQVLGIVVTDLYGRRVSFARATARHFRKDPFVDQSGSRFRDGWLHGETPGASRHPGRMRRDPKKLRA